MDEATPRSPRWARRLLLPAALTLMLTFGLAACGGNNPSNGVATLGNDDSATDTGDDGASSGDTEVTEEERQQAVLDFARCMREHGVDMPDPVFDENGRGGAVIAGGGPESAPDETAMKAAQEACEPLMEDVIGEGNMQPDPEEVAKMQEEALAFAKCMREHGVDMPDPVFEDGGRMTQMIEADGDSANFEAAEEACAKEGGPTMSGGPAVGTGPSVNAGGAK